MIHTYDCLLPERPNIWNRSKPLRKVEKIVLHDPGNAMSANNLISYLQSESNVRNGSYHEIINGNSVYCLIPHTHKAIHAGTLEYSTAWPEMGMNGYQNTYSLGVCIIRPTFDVNAVAEYLRILCTRYDLDPFTDVLCHYQLSSHKTDPIQLSNPDAFGELIVQIAEGGLS